ncbi:hypothetical protein Lal_00021953 [Lupinus albus]|nr:hypothetical protein Lal_00021953 [Lupinus albus]
MFLFLILFMHTSHSFSYAGATMVGTVIELKKRTDIKFCSYDEVYGHKKKTIDLMITNTMYQSWDSRLSERFSPGRERPTWEGEILGYTEGFSPEELVFQEWKGLWIDSGKPQNPKEKM